MEQETSGQESSGEATATLESGSSTGAEQVASDGSQGQENNAGGSQESTESGKTTAPEPRQRPQFRSKQATIFELRQKLRDQEAYWGKEVGTLKSQFAEFQKRGTPRGQEQKPSRTFWEAPEEVMDERFKTHMETLRDEFRNMLQARDSESQETSAWKQETSEATKFILGQKGMTEDDFLEITEIAQSLPATKEFRPKQRAEYALYLWEKQKGIGNRTELKQRAAAVNGAPPTSSGQKIWTEDEIERETLKFPQDPKNWTDEDEKRYKVFDTEIRSAYRQNRVKPKQK